jgi:hypothetical protein
MSHSFFAAQNEQAVGRSVAEQVSLSNAIQQKAVAPVQKVAEEEELPAQMMEEEDELPAQMMSEDEELPVQGKFVAQLMSEEEELPAQGKFITQRKENNTGLPDQLKAGVEQLSNHDMSDVKVSYNSSKPAQLNALAYAQGTEIHVAPGQERHLPHEAWHVAQQKQGRVQATTQLKTGTPVNDDPGLETEADTMGAQAMQVGSQLVNA